MESLLSSLKRISLAADIFQQHTRVQYLLDLSVTVLVPDVSHIKGITDDLLMFHSSSARDWTEGSVGLWLCSLCVRSGKFRFSNSLFLACFTSVLFICEDYSWQKNPQVCCNFWWWWVGCCYNFSWTGPNFMNFSDFYYTHKKCSCYCFIA